MIRVLHVITGMGSGGAEAFIMNMYRHMDREKVQFDFLLRSQECIYTEEIGALGGRIFFTASFPRHFIRNWNETEQFFRDHPEINVVHVHGNALIYMSALILAKNHEISFRIMHSHNTDTNLPIYRILHRINKVFIKKIATDYIACSDEAGRWMFENDFVLINNAIDLDHFSFNPKVRELTRCELKLDGKFVIGHIGRFLESKNHLFLLDIFSEVLKRESDAVLLLIGKGPLEDTVKKRAEKLGVLDSVRFLGVRKDVNDLMQAMDVFVFPSKFEGLGIVLIEAQAAGLRCIASSNIPHAVKATKCLDFFDLDSGPALWAENVLKVRKFSLNRHDMREELAKSGFDIRTEAGKLESLYLSKASQPYRL